MPTFVVKPDRSEDWYVAWSTVVDAPSEWGTRAELVGYGYEADRIDRADECGTSMRGRWWFGWDDTKWIVANIEGIPEREGSHMVKRENVRALCERLEHEQPIADLLTFVPFE